MNYSWSSLVGILSVLALLAPNARGEQAKPAQARPAEPKRWLLIVETSKSMQPRKEAALKSLEGLLLSGMKGQAQTGDTLGVWVFNQSLILGKFPLQTWSTNASREIPSRILGFLSGQKFEKTANLAAVLPDMNAVIKDSAFITVVLVTSGEGSIRGTPFDDAINKVFTEWREQQERQGLPFVTVLRAEGGKLTSCANTPSPWPVQLPPLPSKPAPAQIAEKKAGPAPPKPKPAVGAPLIISGKKNEPDSVPVVASEKPQSPTIQNETASVSTSNTAVAVAEPAVQAITPTPTAPSARTTGPALALPAQVASESVQETGNEKGSEEDILSQQEALSTATVAPAASTTPGKRMTWVVLAGMSAVAFCALVAIVRRSRAVPHASLITRSIDLENR